MKCFLSALPSFAWATFLIIMSYPGWSGILSILLAPVGFALLLYATEKGKPYLCWFLAWLTIHFAWLFWLGQSPLIGSMGFVFAAALAFCFSALALPWLLCYRFLMAGASSSVVKQVISYILLALAWPLVEMSRLWVFTGYPWAQLAWSLLPLDITRNWLHWIGHRGASALIVSFALALLYLITCVGGETKQNDSFGKKTKRRNLLKALLASVIVIASVFTLSLLFFQNSLQIKDKSSQRWNVRPIKEQELEQKRSNSCFTVAVIDTQWKATLEPFSLSELERRWIALIHALLPYEGKVDLVVFPEVVVPGGFQEDIYGPGDSNERRSSLLAQALKASLIIGLEDDRCEEGSIKNALFYFDSNGRLLHSYGKKRLLPFSETIPSLGNAKLNTIIRKQLQDRGIHESLVPGKSDSLIHLFPPYGPKVHLSICFEETFPSTALSSAMRGAALMISSSHDGWFSGTQLPYMHLWQARLVSAVTSLPLIRSTHQGESGAINIDGTILRNTNRIDSESLKKNDQGLEILFFALYSEEN